MMMEKLVKWWLAGENEVLGENLSQCRFVYHKPHMLRPGANPCRRGGKRATNRFLRYGTAWRIDLPNLGFEVFTAVVMKVAIFWDIARVVVMRTVCSHASFLLGSFLTLKMEAIRSSKTSANIQTKRRYIPEDGNFQFYQLFINEIPKPSDWCVRYTGIGSAS
jgi:hypothetical protein